MPSGDKSGKIRDYAIAGFFTIGSIFAVLVFLKIFLVLDSEPASVWSECTADSANVFIGANSELKAVKCTALDREFFSNPEIVLGELSKNDEDVCRFRLAKNTSEPLRFEVAYNGKVKREVCSWQRSGGID